MIDPIIASGVILNQKIVCEYIAFTRAPRPHIQIKLGSRNILCISGNRFILDITFLLLQNIECVNAKNCMNKLIATRNIKMQ